MKEEQQDNSQSDQDIEIVDIDDVPAADKKITSRPVPLPRFTVQQRRRQALVTVSLITLVLLGIISSNVSIRNKLVQAVVPPTPSPTAPIVPGTDSFYVSRDVGWGHLFLDGKLIALVPNADNHGGIPDSPIHLARGTHTLLWRANPFPPKTCTVSVPNNYQTDTCKYDQIASTKQGSGWKVTFPANITELPVVSRNALIAAAQAAMQSYTSNDIVQTGEVYATNGAGTQQSTAREPLKVTTHYELDTDPSSSSRTRCGPFTLLPRESCTINQQNCHSFCAPGNNSFSNSPQSSQVWNVYVVVRAVREFVTMNGTHVIRHQVDMLDPLGMVYEQIIPLQILWNETQWHVTTILPQDTQSDMLPGFVSAVCDRASNRVDQDASLRIIPQSSTATVTTWNYFAATTTATDCLGIVTLEQSQTPAASQTQAYCFYHFGIFLAANEVAHKYWPTMPLADAHEKQLAQQLADIYKKRMGN